MAERGQIGVLLVEDSPADAELVRHTLARAGFDADVETVGGLDGLAPAMARRDLDVVLADYHVPGLALDDIKTALSDAGSTAPLIVVTGAIGEERAVELVKSGVADVVLKDNLGRLGPVVQAALDTARMRRLERDAQRDAAESLRARLELASIIEATDDAVVSQSLDGTILTWNRGAETLYGWKAGEAVGRPASIVVPPDLASERARIAARAAAGERVVGLETRRIRKDGRLVDVSLTVSPLRDASGAVTGVSVIGHDVSARKREEQRLRMVLEAAPDAMVVVDAGGVITLVNGRAEELFGYTRDELVGSPVEMLVPLDRRADHPRQRAAYAADPTVRPVGLGREVAALHRDGREIPVEISLGPLETDEGAYVCAAVRDVSSRKVAEARQRQFDVKLLESQKLETLGVLAGGIAHDFNNLLAVILGSASFALQTHGDDSALAPRLRQIEDAGERAADLTRQLLAYAGKGRFVVEPTDLADLVQGMAGLLESTVPKKVTLEVASQPETPAVEVDATQIRQVVLNLITNAAEAVGDRPGRIIVRTGKLVADDALLATFDGGDQVDPGEFALLEVSDTGCGMDAPTRSRMFDPFFTTKFTGTGLGLAAVIGIVRGHGGALAVESVPGAGTTIRIILPALAAAAPARDAPHEDRAWQGSGTVLLVDDESGVRQTARLMLEALGLEVLTAADGGEALSIATERDGGLDLILLDLRMPVLGGDEVLAELHRRGVTTPVILSSGYSATAVELPHGEGPVGFLQKPYRYRELVEAVQRALGEPPPAQADAPA